MLYTAGPEKLIIGKFLRHCHGRQIPFVIREPPDDGLNGFPVLHLRRNMARKTAEFLPRIHSRGNTVIGNDVWIGREAVVMPDVTIGDGTIIAARAVVVSDVTPYTTVGGNPARPLRKRYSDEDIDRLLRLAWWNWPVDVITEHVRTIWTGTPVELEQTAKDAGLLD